MDASLSLLRGLVGTAPDDAHLESLLQRFQTVEAAANAYFDGSSTTTSAPKLGQKRQASFMFGPNKEQKLTTSSGPSKEQPVSDCPAAGITPLAERMRPKQVDNLYGQESALGDVLRQALAEDRLPSMVLWGPPGCGKTSFAACVASSTKRIFRALSATKVGVSELREELTRASNAQRLRGMNTILFVDELHRWSKTQQDAILLDCEKGTVTLIGATTENPSFSLNNAILSRCRLVIFNKLSSNAILTIIDRALQTDEKLQGTVLTDGARSALVAAADGDARVALNALELVAGRGDAACHVDESAVLAAVQRRSLYDRNGDFHYDLISALHKSMRGGDPDGAVYYVARMLHGGEEPRYITRRLIRFASEDVGLADPEALPQAVAADAAVHAIGMPEAGVVIAQAACYLALAPKSCAVYKAWNAAMAACSEEPHAPVPLHIRNAPTAIMKQIGYSKGYVYNPSNGYARGCNQGYLPHELGKGRTFFNHTDCEPGHVLKFCQAGPHQAN